MQNGVLKFAFETHVHRVLLKIILALTNFTSNRNSVKNFTQGFKQGFTKRFNFENHTRTQAPTLSLRGSGQITREARRAEFDGMGWDGTEYQKCPLKFFILCGFIDKVYTYLYM